MDYKVYKDSVFSDVDKLKLGDKFSVDIPEGIIKFFDIIYDNITTSKLLHEDIDYLIHRLNSVLEYEFLKKGVNVYIFKDPKKNIIIHNRFRTKNYCEKIMTMIKAGYKLHIILVGYVALYDYDNISDYIALNGRIEYEYYDRNEKEQKNNYVKFTGIDYNGIIIDTIARLALLYDEDPLNRGGKYNEELHMITSHRRDFDNFSENCYVSNYHTMYTPAILELVRQLREKLYSLIKINIDDTFINMINAYFDDKYIDENSNYYYTSGTTIMNILTSDEYDNICKTNINKVNVRGQHVNEKVKKRIELMNTPFDEIVCSIDDYIRIDVYDFGDSITYSSIFIYNLLHYNDEKHHTILSLLEDKRIKITESMMIFIAKYFDIHALLWCISNGGVYTPKVLENVCKPYFGRLHPIEKLKLIEMYTPSKNKNSLDFLNKALRNIIKHQDGSYYISPYVTIFEGVGTTKKSRTSTNRRFKECAKSNFMFWKDVSGSIKELNREYIIEKMIKTIVSFGHNISPNDIYFGLRFGYMFDISLLKNISFGTGYYRALGFAKFTGVNLRGMNGGKNVDHYSKFIHSKVSKKEKGIDISILEEMCKLSDYINVKKYIEGGMKPTQKCLENACYCGNTVLIKYLISKGVNINVTCIENYTRLLSNKFVPDVLLSNYKKTLTSPITDTNNPPITDTNNTIANTDTHTNTNNIDEITKKDTDIDEDSKREEMAKQIEYSLVEMRNINIKNDIDLSINIIPYIRENIKKIMNINKKRMSFVDFRNYMLNYLYKNNLFTNNDVKLVEPFLFDGADSIRIIDINNWIYSLLQLDTNNVLPQVKSHDKSLDKRNDKTDTKYRIKSIIDMDDDNIDNNDNPNDNIFIKRRRKTTTNIIYS